MVSSLLGRYNFTVVERVPMRTPLVWRVFAINAGPVRGVELLLGVPAVEEL